MNEPATFYCKKEAVRLIIPQEKPINPEASQSNRLVLRQRLLSTRHAKTFTRGKLFSKDSPGER